MQYNESLFNTKGWEGVAQLVRALGFARSITGIHICSTELGKGTHDCNHMIRRWTQPWEAETLEPIR